MIESCEGVCLLCVESEASSVCYCCVCMCISVSVCVTLETCTAGKPLHIPVIVRLGFPGAGNTACPSHCTYTHHRHSSHTHLQVFNFIVLHGVAITLRDGGGVVNR